MVPNCCLIFKRLLKGLFGEDRKHITDFGIDHGLTQNAVSDQGRQLVRTW